MKRNTIIIIAVVVVLALGLMFMGSGGKKEAQKAEAPAGSVSKIGIITPTTAQNEEEYRAAEELIRKHPGRVLHVTYPDKFMDEQETTMQQIMTLASDPDVKAIVFAQGYPGTAAAVDKVHDTRPEVIFINTTPHEDPPLAASKSVYLMESDQPARGRSIIELAQKMGAKTFVHYSFPRHMAMAPLAERRELFEKTCKELGIRFVSVNAPDPTGDAGLAGAQQFILEDVPRQVAKYGKDTAFFSTNCGMQDPLIVSVMQTGAIFPEQCCPSPYHGYPGALGISIPEDKAGDVDFLIEQIHAKVKEAGMGGRMATWKVPASMAMVYGAADYAFAYADGEIGAEYNEEKAIETLKKYAGDIQTREYQGADGQIVPRFLVFVGESVIFGQN